MAICPGVPNQLEMPLVDRLPDGRPSVGAVFSPCERYRYRLWRYWQVGVAPVTWVLLNPSTANEMDNDPTVRRCQQWSYRWGAGGIEVVNLFAYRGTDPREMMVAAAPVGPDNDAAIIAAASTADRIIVAWGVHGGHRDRAAAVELLLADCPADIFCLARTAGGFPGHPLYLPASATPITYPLPASSPGLRSCSESAG